MSKFEKTPNDPRLMPMNRALVLVAAVRHVLGKVWEALPTLVVSRNTRMDRERSEKVRIAISKVETTPIREVEDEIGLDKYEYRTVHDGFSTHERRERPTSRKAEEKQLAESSENNARRIEEYAAMAETRR